jgi:dTDP-4-amino-4,6-dideoxygalactose transaminase
MPIGNDDGLRLHLHDTLFDTQFLGQLSRHFGISPNYYISTLGSDGNLEEMFPNIQTIFEAYLNDLNILDGYHMELMDNATSIYITLVTYFKLINPEVKFTLTGVSYADNTRALNHNDITYNVIDVDEDGFPLINDIEPNTVFVFTPLDERHYGDKYNKLLQYCSTHSITLLEDQSYCISDKSQGDYKYFSTGGQKCIPAGWGGILLMKEEYKEEYNSHREQLLDLILHAINVSVYNMLGLLGVLKVANYIKRKHNEIYDWYEECGIVLTYRNPVGMYKVKDVAKFFEIYDNKYKDVVDIIFKRNALIPDNEVSNVFLDLGLLDVTPTARTLANQIICLPITLDMTKDKVNIICKLVKTINKEIENGV